MHFTSDMSLPTSTPEDKLREIEHLLDLYDTAIGRQQTQLDKCKRGKFKSAQVSDDVLHALVKGELTLLQKKKEEYMKSKEKLEKQVKSRKNGTNSLKASLETSSDTD